ncbi:hypothetical protein [Cohnella soli]|uniref:PDZ domain-containing protein n=1 Tax=Cohnella soli TaxID=425005 RepID=A0ABW0I474_9BACL
MTETEKSKTVNTIWIEAPVSEIWPYVTTTRGWKLFLADIAYIANGKEEVELNDRLRLVLGELSNRSVCTEYRRYKEILYDETYASILPNGRLWEYRLETMFTFEEADGMTQMTVTVDGYGEDEMMQWVRECGEMGWRQSLLHLKNVIELGLDLRDTIFNYPRLGVLNYTATEEQLKNQGLAGSGVRGNYIKTVYPGGPSHKAGLPGGCIVASIGGVAVPDYQRFVEALGRFYGKPGNIDLVYYEQGERKTTNVALTYDDQFTGMIDPNSVPLEEVQRNRSERSI